MFTDITVQCRTHRHILECCVLRQRTMFTDITVQCRTHRHILECCALRQRTMFTDITVQCRTHRHILECCVLRQRTIAVDVVTQQITCVVVTNGVWHTVLHSSAPSLLRSWPHTASNAMSCNARQCNVILMISSEAVFENTKCRTCAKCFITSLLNYPIE